jgi:hypothetical protein
MLKAYATVCRQLGCESAGGLEDAYVVTHPGKAHGTSRTGRAIDRVLVDPRLIGSIPGLVDAAHVHQNMLQVVGQSGTLRAAPDHKAVKAVLRLSDIKRPPHRPRYTLTGLSAARRAEVELCVDTILKDEQRDPEETEANYVTTVSAMIDGYRTADRKANNCETHKLISKLDNLQRDMRRLHTLSPLLTALKAHAGRVRVQLHRVMQRRAEAHANTREQQRWRREQSDSKALYESIKPDKAINLPFDVLRIPDGVDAKGDPIFKTVRGQHEVAAGCHENWKALFNEVDWRPDEEATRRMLEPILQDTSRHLDAATAASLTIDKIFTPLAVIKALNAICKGTMPGSTGISTDLLAHRAWRKRMAAHLARRACKIFGKKQLGRVFPQSGQHAKSGR